VSTAIWVAFGVLILLCVIVVWVASGHFDPH